MQNLGNQYKINDAEIKAIYRWSLDRRRREVSNSKIPVKYLEQRTQINWNWARLEKFDICFWVIYQYLLIFNTLNGQRLVSYLVQKAFSSRDQLSFRESTV